MVKQEMSGSKTLLANNQQQTRLPVRQGTVRAMQNPQLYFNLTFIAAAIF